jgi:hypothetical protein
VTPPPGMIAALVLAGADLNLRDRYGNLPLHAAAALGNRYHVVTLLRCGSLINIKRHDGRTAYMLATRNGYSKIADLLTDPNLIAPVIKPGRDATEVSVPFPETSVARKRSSNPSSAQASRPPVQHRRTAPRSAGAYHAGASDPFVSPYIAPPTPGEADVLGKRAAKMYRGPVYHYQQERRAETAREHRAEDYEQTTTWASETRTSSGPSSPRRSQANHQHPHHHQQQQQPRSPTGHGGSGVGYEAGPSSPRQTAARQGEVSAALSRPKTAPAANNTGFAGDLPPRTRAASAHQGNATARGGNTRRPIPPQARHAGAPPLPPRSHSSQPQEHHHHHQQQPTTSARERPPSRPHTRLTFADQDEDDGNGYHDEMSNGHGDPAHLPSLRSASRASSRKSENIPPKFAASPYSNIIFGDTRNIYIYIYILLLHAHQISIVMIMFIDAMTRMRI